VTQTLLRGGRIRRIWRALPFAHCRAIAAVFVGFSTAAMRRTQVRNVSFWDATASFRGTWRYRRSGNALDSAFLSTARRLQQPRQPAIRISPRARCSGHVGLAVGAFAGFQNDGDNEITGWHRPTDTGVGGLLGAKIPTPFRDGWRLSSPSRRATTPGKIEGRESTRR